MQKHMVNLRLFQSRLGDLAKLAGKNKYFSASIIANTHSHIPADHPENAGFKYKCYISDVGTTSEVFTMEEALKEMKTKVKAYLDKSKEVKTETAENLAF